jgi:hypothetical protein
MFDRIFDSLANLGRRLRNFTLDLEDDFLLYRNPCRSRNSLLLPRRQLDVTFREQRKDI